MSTPGSPLNLDRSHSAPPASVGRAILTREGERALREELERLRRRLEGEFAERLREARDAGVGPENDEYLQVQEEEALVAARARQLETLLELATIVDADGGTPDIVAIGSWVEVENLASGKVRRHRLTGGFEPLEPDDISVNSPVGQALLGRAAGDEVKVELPGGRNVELRVRRIEPRRPTAQPSRA